MEREREREREGEREKEREREMACEQGKNTQEMPGSKKEQRGRMEKVCACVSERRQRRRKKDDSSQDE